MSLRSLSSALIWRSECKKCVESSLVSVCRWKYRACTSSPWYRRVHARPCTWPPVVVLVLLTSSGMHPRQGSEVSRLPLSIDGKMLEDHFEVLYLAPQGDVSGHHSIFFRKLIPAVDQRRQEHSLQSGLVRTPPSVRLHLRQYCLVAAESCVFQISAFGPSGFVPMAPSEAG